MPFYHPSKISHLEGTCVLNLDKQGGYMSQDHVYTCHEQMKLIKQQMLMDRNTSSDEKSH